MKLIELLGATSLGLSTLLGLPAAAAVDTANLVTEPTFDWSVEAVILEQTAGENRLDNLDIDQEEVQLAYHPYIILITNESSVDVAYDLDGISYQLASGMWRAHSFYSHRGGKRNIDFDFSPAYGWQNQTYILSLDSSFTFQDLGYGLVDLYPI